jgi:uncharacterized membrane protein
MVIVAALAILLLQTPPAKAPPVPQNPGPSRLIERPTLRPSRADNARENLARDPNEPKQPAEMPEPEAPSEPEPAAAAPAPAPAPPAPPAAGLAPMAPSAVSPGATPPTATAAALNAPAAVPAKGAAAWLSLLPIGAPLAMLIGPGIGLLWMAARRGPAQ